MNDLKPLKPDEAYDPEQLAKGAKVELEHTSNPETAKTIAKAHLDESSDYYIALDKMEKDLKNSRPRGVPKTDEERRATHKKLYGNDELPPRGTGRVESVIFVPLVGQTIIRRK